MGKLRVWLNDRVLAQNRSVRSWGCRLDVQHFPDVPKPLDSILSPGEEGGEGQQDEKK